MTRIVAQEDRLAYRENPRSIVVLSPMRFQSLVTEHGVTIRPA